MSGSLRAVLLAVLLAVPLAVAARAQAPDDSTDTGGSAMLEGHVRSADGASLLARARLDLRPAEAGTPAHIAYTGPDGAYRLAGIAAGSYTLRVTAPGFEAVEETGLTFDENETRTRDVTLEPLPSVRVAGRVTYDGTAQPARGVLVLFSGPGGEQVSARTDADGRYEARVPDGDGYVAFAYQIGADSSFIYTEYYDDAASAAEAVRLNVGNGAVTTAGGDPVASVDFAIPNLDREVAATVRGRVVDEAGQPVEDALVIVRNYFGYWDLVGFTARTDADGRYTVTTEGRYLQRLQVHVEAEGYVTTFYDGQTVDYLADPVVVPIDDPVVEGIDFVLAAYEQPSGEELSGRVTNGAGQALAGVLVTATGTETLHWVHTYTAADGTYTLAGLHDPTYAILFSTDGYVPTFAGGAHTWADAAPVTVAGADPVEAVLEAIPAGGGGTVLTGRVTDVEGQSLSGVLVAAADEQGRWLGHALTDARGGYRIEQLRGGVVYLRAGAAGRDEVDRDVALGAGEAVRIVDFTMSAGRTVAREAPDDVPAAFALEAAYPNPFNPVTTFSYTLARPGAVSLKVFDARGREVVTLFEGRRTAGTHSARFDAAGLPSGLYLYRLVTEAGATSRTVVLLR